MTIFLNAKYNIFLSKAYFRSVNAENYDDNEALYTDGIDKIPHILAKKFINTLKETWRLEERNGECDEGIQLSFNSASIAVAETFDNIIKISYLKRPRCLRKPISKILLMKLSYGRFMMI